MLALALAVFIFGGVVAFHAVSFFLVDKAYMTRERRPVVSTITLEYSDLTPKLNAVGTLIADQSVQVSSQVSGMIESIHFSSGSAVESGQALIQLDAGIAQQKYIMDQANLAFKKDHLARQESLFSSNATSTEKRDQAKAEYLSQEALTKQDKIVLDNHTIRAPFSGTLGLKNVDIGQFITPGQPLTQLQKTNPIKIDFTLASKYLDKLHLGMEVTVYTDQYPEQAFSGKISAIDTEVNPSTRTIKARALFDNIEENLLPGQSGRIKLILPLKKNTLLLPRTAVSVSLYGNTVYKVKQASTDKDRYYVTPVVIQTGEITDTYVEVISGLENGDMIVSSGQNKLYPDVEILINNSFPN